MQEFQRKVGWDSVKEQNGAIITAISQNYDKEAGGMSSTVFKPFLTAFFASQPTKYRGLPRFFHYFCDKVTIEPGSIEEQLFSYLRGQNCIYVDAADVFGQSRRVIGVVSSRLLKVLHYPSPPPTKPVIIDTALRMLCVPEAV
jgi:hypothetical protein